jgi:putative endonuclease
MQRSMPSVLRPRTGVRIPPPPAFDRLRQASPWRATRAHFIYIVRCADGTLYTGYARDPVERERVHNSGRGARYTRGRGPVRLVYLEACDSRGDALRRERAVKRLTRASKEALVADRRPPATASVP